MPKVAGIMTGEMTPLSLLINAWEHPAQSLLTQCNFIPGVKIYALEA